MALQQRTDNDNLRATMKVNEYETKSGKPIRLWQGDCMEFMQDLEPNAYDLCIVDPPYGIGISNNSFRQKHSKSDWDNAIPNKDYFDKLNSKTKDQIIWGGNYFDLPPSQGFIIWDKKQPEDFSSAMCEYAWLSKQEPAKIFRDWVVINGDGKKIHPTQKPIKLYRWLLQNYAEEGDTILDSHGGSMSLAIACYIEDFELDIIELDEGYYSDAVERFENHVAQKTLF